MSEIKIFVTHTPGRSSVLIRHPLFYHVAAGSELQSQPKPKGMLADNEGENISDKNQAYCELTTQYWVWKNIDADYYGFCHYRRYFSFAPQQMPESDCGCLVFPYLDAGTQQRLHLSEREIREAVEPYDFLIAKGIPAAAFRAKNVRQHYRNADHLHDSDLERMVTVINEKYPQLGPAAEAYLNGKIFYPCNMFIMRKVLFEAYSAMLFDILKEVEQRMDMSRYSREGYRTPGHLGERFLGIFYQYLSGQGNYRLGELQMALIEHTDAQTYQTGIFGGQSSGTDAAEDTVRIVLAADENYVPVLFTCIQSIFDHADRSRNYRICIFYTEIAQESRELFCREFGRPGFAVVFIDVSAGIAGYCLKGKGHIPKETYYRFLIADYMKDDPKAVYLDADVAVCKDLARLYDTDLEDCWLAAVVEADMAGQYNGANPDTKRYCDDILRMKDPYSYFQAGVLVWNIKAWRENIQTEELFLMAETGKYRYSDQDILNIVCEGHVKQLDMAWNVLADHMHYRYDHVIRYAPYQVLDAYETARKNPYIIHYAGERKPWKDPRGDFAREFWQTARRTPYYEALLYEMDGMGHADRKKKKLSTAAVNALRSTAKKILPQGSWIRRKVGGLYWKLK